MQTAREYTERMKHVQIRNVPEELHRTLKVRAAQAGMSLSDYVLAELRRATDRPTREEILARVRTRRSPKLRVSPADAVRAERDSR
jgi:antitoxin FitA